MYKLILKLFPKIKSLVFEDGVIHANWKDKCDLYYIDTNGKKYYKYKDLFDLPIKRREYMEGLLNLWEISFTTKEYDKFILHMKETVGKAVNDVDKRGEYLAKLMIYVEELEGRKDIMINPNTMLELMSVIMIREDESPFEIDHKIVDQKTEQFKKDDKLRDSSFFLQTGLERSIPYLNVSEEELQKYIQNGLKQIELSNQKLGKLYMK